MVQPFIDTFDPFLVSLLALFSDLSGGGTLAWKCRQGVNVMNAHHLRRVF
jgi:hypothetical protein